MIAELKLIEIIRQAQDKLAHAESILREDIPEGTALCREILAELESELSEANT